MPHWPIDSRSEPRERALRGAATVADAVRVTLGPKPRCVLVERTWGRALVCDDGVTIAQEVDLAESEENLDAQMIRETTERTRDRVGDGTTTSGLTEPA